MLLTTRNWCVSLPAASSSGKYFWLAFIVRIRHSAGTVRNSGSNWHSSTLGRSTRAVTSSSSASSSMGFRPVPALAATCQLAGDLGTALGKAGDHRALAPRVAA
jgi:hypothetical protein